MARPLCALVLAALAALPALAQESVSPPMSAAEFDRYATGKTLFYATRGQAYGAEQYLPGRRVIWTFLDGDCAEGEWYEASGLICFRYDREPLDPQCWSFFEAPSGLVARYENDPGQTELIEVEQSREPLICTGPEVGV